MDSEAEGESSEGCNQQSWRPVASGVPQGSMFTKLIFSRLILLVYDLDEGLEHSLSKFAAGMNLGGVA